MQLNHGNKITIILGIALLFASHVFCQKKYEFPFQDPALCYEERVNDLVDRMTIEEKISQLFNSASAIERLHVPEYNWWNEALHGVARAGKATVFPQAIGLAASFNQPLLFEIATAISDEARAKHHYFKQHNIHSIYTGLTFWSPNINIFRDPRWGRGQETYGEDPYLTGRMAVSFIKGLQGNDLHYLKTIATAKHYAVHSGPEFSRHQDNVFVNDRDLYATYLPAFRAAVQEANVQSVMCAYNRFRDQPCCGSNLLLNTILRQQFKFKGYVVSDCGAISDFYSVKSHHVVGSVSEAWGWSLSSGTDLNCEDSKSFIPSNIDSAIDAGIINVKDVDVSLHRLFKARFMLGLFDPEEMVSYNKIPVSVVGDKAHVDLSLRSAEQAIVLLKNDGILPFKNVKNIALIGPNANNLQVLLGNYNGLPIDPATPLKALQEKMGVAHIFYSAGTPIVNNVYVNLETIPGRNLFHIEKGKKIRGLKGEYFSTTHFLGIASISRVDSAIDFYWPFSPLNGKVEDTFSVRWSGLLIPTISGDYVFGGNVLVKVNQEPVKGGKIFLEAGKEYSLIAELSVEPFWWGNTVEPTATLSWVNTTTDYQKQSMEAAAQSDIIIFCGGISPQLEGEEMPLEIDGFAHGDRTHINLPAVQEELLKKLKATGKKIVYVNFSGSAVALNWESENLSAILQAFYPGEQGGRALVNILFGQTNPSGRLPITFYKTIHDLPPFKDYKMAGRTYRYFKGDPLYPFGYGLSYSRFLYRNFHLPNQVACGDSIAADVEVYNQGPLDGEEVVQIYVSQTDTSFESPLRSMAGFKRVFLKAGESRIVSMTIQASQLAIINHSFKSEIVPGKLNIYVGGRQPDKKSQEEKTVLRQQITLTGSSYALP